MENFMKGILVAYIAISMFTNIYFVIKEEKRIKKYLSFIAGCFIAAGAFIVNGIVLLAKAAVFIPLGVLSELTNVSKLYSTGEKMVAVTAVSINEAKAEARARKDQKIIDKARAKAEAEYNAELEREYETNREANNLRFSRDCDVNVSFTSVNRGNHREVNSIMILDHNGDERTFGSIGIKENDKAVLVDFLERIPHVLVEADESVTTELYNRNRRIKLENRDIDLFDVSSCKKCVINIPSKQLRVLFGAYCSDKTSKEFGEEAIAFETALNTYEMLREAKIEMAQSEAFCNEVDEVKDAIIDAINNNVSPDELKHKLGLDVEEETLEAYAEIAAGAVEVDVEEVLEDITQQAIDVEVREVAEDTTDEDVSELVETAETCKVKVFFPGGGAYLEKEMVIPEEEFDFTEDDLANIKNFYA